MSSATSRSSHAGPQSDRSARRAARHATHSLASGCTASPSDVVAVSDECREARVLQGGHYQARLQLRAPRRGDRRVELGPDERTRPGEEIERRLRPVACEVVRVHARRGEQLQRQFDAAGAATRRAEQTLRAPATAAPSARARSRVAGSAPRASASSSCSAPASAQCARHDAVGEMRCGLDSALGGHGQREPELARRRGRRARLRERERDGMTRLAARKERDLFPPPRELESRHRRLARLARAVLDQRAAREDGREHTAPLARGEQPRVPGVGERRRRARGVGVERQGASSSPPARCGSRGVASMESSAARRPLSSMPSSERRRAVASTWRSSEPTARL